MICLNHGIADIIINFSFVASRESMNWQQKVRLIVTYSGNQDVDYRERDQLFCRELYWYCLVDFPSYPYIRVTVLN